MAPNPLLLAAALVAALASTPTQALPVTLVIEDPWKLHDQGTFAWEWDGAAGPFPADELPHAFDVVPRLPALPSPDSGVGGEWMMQFDSTGVPKALAISPVPEPSALLALLAGLGVVAGMSRRRR